MTTAAQSERWAASTRALEARDPDAGVCLVVPEWSDIVPPNDKGEPAIYAGPWTTQDEQAIARHVALDDPEGWVRVLVRKATDQDGNRLWHIAHRVHLLRLPHDTVRRVAWAIMMGDPDPDPEVILGG